MNNNLYFCSQSNYTSLIIYLYSLSIENIFNYMSYRNEFKFKLSVYRSSAHRNSFKKLLTITGHGAPQQIATRFTR